MSMPRLESTALRRCSVGSLREEANETRRPPADSGSTRALVSLNCASTRCSSQSWVTERRVYLKSGTHRTFLMTRRMYVPSEALAMTGMSPMYVALATLPSAEE